jgi:hypothetical protein
MLHSTSTTHNELFYIKRQFYDAHIHDWTKTSSKYPFKEDFFDQHECVQFRLESSKSRAHGYIIGNCFYILWLDPYHNLYPDDRHGGLKYFEKPLSCFEILNRESIQLSTELLTAKEENGKLNDILQMRTQ